MDQKPALDGLVLTADPTRNRCADVRFFSKSPQLRRFPAPERLAEAPEVEHVFPSWEDLFSACAEVAGSGPIHETAPPCRSMSSSYWPLRSGRSWDSPAAGPSRSAASSICPPKRSARAR